MEEENKIVMVFDFDKTLIECDSDDWVVDNFGLTELFNALLPTMPYNSLMDKMMGEFHSQGTTIHEIEECLKNIPMSRDIISAIKSAYASGCDLRIVSDANTFFVETILKHNEILHCFSEINTNSSIVDENGRLKILPFHDFNSSSHGCNLCPPNLCKGQVIERIQVSLKEKSLIYIGDGKNDYCPSLRLSSRDYVLPRKEFPLWNAILDDITLVKASVHEWNDWEELENTLINLINYCVRLKSDHIFNSDEYFVDCKSRVSPISTSTLKLGTL